MDHGLARSGRSRRGIGDLIVANRDRQFIIAGGLNSENVAEAVNHARPFGVDVASGVETAPGRKDIYRVRDFIAAARSA
jgi:phosphoribosylanthranilate isomerase